MARYLSSIRWIAALGGIVSGSACTPFVAVHPAAVEPGVNISFQAALTTPPGDDAAWFWSFDCAFECNHVILAPDLGVHIATDEAFGLPLQVGVGMAGSSGYTEIYKQMGDAPGRPWGVGGRIGIPWADWSEHRLFARFERPAGDHSLVLNPTLYLYTGNSPNGQNPGTFVAFIQGFGLVDRRERTTVIPALAAGVGRGWRKQYGEEIGPFNTAFATASISIIVHRQRVR
jgi:hypothetical protein